MKSITDLAVENKKVLVRVDLNVPMNQDGTITDETRILGVLPTIEYLLTHNAKVILCSHCGRPKGERNPKFSLAPVAQRLSQLLNKDIPLAPDCIGPEVKKMTDNLQNGQLLLLENLRFHPQEQQNDNEFSNQLANLADIYINDAFAVSHRAHSSVEGVTHHFDVLGAGFLLGKEMEFFKRSIANPTRPLTAILGGAKVSSKLGAIRNMLDKVDSMIIGGAMANTFLKSQGYEIGKSLVENDLLSTANEYINLAKEKNVALYLPTDCIVADTFEETAVASVALINAIPKQSMILDIGPQTIELFNKALESASTIVWNGPMGAFEMKPFSKGSMAIVDTLCKSDALSIVGGGDTNVVINKAGAADDISYMSTGGGAFLMLMEGKELPGVAALNN